MTMDEIKARKLRVDEAAEKLRQANDALRGAQEQYAEQEARKAGIVYGVTKVNCTQKPGEEFVVTGMDKWAYNEPCYTLRKIKKDGTPSAFGLGTYYVRLRHLTLVEGAT